MNKPTTMTDLDQVPIEERRRLLEQLLSNRATESGPSPQRAEPPSPPPAKSHPFAEYVNPHLAALLHAFKLDKRFVRGEGCWLYDHEGKRYLDFTAAYGALPFGFNPPEIWEAITSVATQQLPSIIQPSLLEASGRLAEKLISIAPAGLRYVTFANSGAETIEVAIKLARSATGRLGILSTHNGFHGKTLGALSATGRPLYQRAFGAPAQGFEYVPYGSLEALEAVVSRKSSELAAVLLEPLQGEGGIVVPPPGYLTGARELCTRHGVLLILDEVQTGLGRTGTLFACEQEGVVPDIMTLAKALGGGLIPIGAVLSTAECFNEEFAVKHTSTFAGNTLACEVGLRSLELITRNGQELVRNVAENGRYLRNGLEEIQKRFPELIRSIRGHGYMQGVELTTDIGAFGRQCLLASMAAQESLSLAICSYLLNVEGIRMAPTVFGTKVIRVEPPLVATREHCEYFLGALERTLVQVQTCETPRVFAHLVGRPPAPPPTAPVPRRSVPRSSGAPSEGRWGFIAHPLDFRSYIDFDESLKQYSDAEVEELVLRLNDARINLTTSSMVMGATRVHADTSATAHGEILAVPYTADELLELPGAAAVAQVREAVELARDRGARIVGLGAFTSVVTKNGLYLKDCGVSLTTGNSFTVASAVESVFQAASALHLRVPDVRIAMVGATGSIGRAVSLLLSEEAGQLVLVGNPAHPQRSLERLRAVGRDIVLRLSRMLREGRRFAPNSLGDTLATLGAGRADAPESAVEEWLHALQRSGRLECTADPASQLVRADLIITATSSTRVLVTPENLKPGAVVCDVSRPSNVSPLVRQNRPDVLVLDGGIIEVPRQQDLGIAFGLAPGLTYACMAETMILSLEQRYQDGSMGDELHEDFIQEIRQLARKHGFRVAAPRSDGRRLEASDWARIARARESRAQAFPVSPRADVATG
jgi:acetylornithine/succinyldiaminopimelate/putrescine aminotransferase/predicted amino acid dehydrogenase